MASEPSGRAAVFAVTALGAFMVSLDLSIVNMVFPALARALPGEAQASLAWVITAYAIMFGSLLITAGRTADRLGRRRAFLLEFFRHRSFSVANAATLAYAMGFFAMVLGNILFLTRVWHYGILRAGLAVTPGPIMVAITSGPAGAWARRAGFRRVLLVGFSIFAVGLGWYAARVGLTPAYLADWLPGTLITGVGIGLTFPVLAGASVSSLPAAHYAVGSAVNQTARQIGGAIGVAILVVILGSGSLGPLALTHFRHLWEYACAMVVLGGALNSGLQAPS